MVSEFFLKQVENNEEGQEYIKQVKSFYKNKNCKVSLKGRHSNRTRLFRELGRPRTRTMDVPIRYAERISIYIYPNEGIEYPEFKERIDNWKEELGE